MPRPSRTSEVPQRPSPSLRGPRHLRTSSSDSDPLLQRCITYRSPRLGVGDHRSPRNTKSEPLKQKKLGTRITDLETQLVSAQHELKILKQQLSSAEAAKKQAQQELHKKGNKKPTTTARKVQGREKQPHIAAEIQELELRDKPQDEVHEDSHQETDVFEVPVEKRLVEDKSELTQCSVDNDRESNSFDSTILEPENPYLCNELASKGEEIDELRARVEEKEKKFQEVIEENETLKQQLEEAKSQIALAHTKEEQMGTKLNQLGEELAVSKANTVKLEEKIGEAEATKESLEAEVKKMKVQTEQWRKAADAAAAVLAGRAEINGRISERCASMDKHFSSVFEQPANGYGVYLGSPGEGDDNDDGFGGGKKKGSGIRMLGDLWKKKGSK